MTSKTLKLITQLLLLTVIFFLPLAKLLSLYLPHISLKAYLFRLLVLLALFFWFWLMLKEKKYLPHFKNFLVMALILFFLAQAVTAFLGIDPLFSFFSSWIRHDGVLQYGFWVLYFLMLISVFQEKKDWQWLFLVFIGSAFLVAVGAWRPMESKWRVGFSFFGNHAYLAAYLLFAIGFCFLLLAKKYFKNFWLNVLIWVNAGFLTLTLIFTQIRGAYFGLAGALTLFLILATFFLRKENKKLSLLAGLILFLMIILTCSLFWFGENPLIKNQPLLARITEIAKVWQVSSVKDRLLTWQIALKGFKDKPIFGWGPENFGAINNKYYDFRVGEGEPWFDRAHNQVLDILATGGIFLFIFYLFWLGAVGYYLYKIGKKEKILGFLLASIFLAYFGQGLFLFDTIGVYLGLFPFLAFLVFENKQLKTEEKENFAELKKKNNFLRKPRWFILAPIGFLILWLIYLVCFLPYRANHYFWQFYNYNANQLYEKAAAFLPAALKIKSPYTYWEVRKRVGWELLDILSSSELEKMPLQQKEIINSFYDFIMPELEKLAVARPYEQQTYFLLGSLYRLGSEKLNRQDLAKAERALKQGLNYSNLRFEYYNVLAAVLLQQGKFDEAEKLIKDYISRVNFSEDFPYLTLGHFYFIAGKYDLAFAEYEKAEAIGYQFEANEFDYSRYLVACEETGHYQQLVRMIERYLAKNGPKADTYYNLAVGYLKMGEKEKAREFWQKAVELDREYEKYKIFFELNYSN
ncbi:MAG: O-antigen ligase family protein [Minisyncoccales bacterium]